MHDHDHADVGRNARALDRRDFLKRSAAVGAAAMGLSVFGLGETSSFAGSSTRWWGSLAQPSGPGPLGCGARARAEGRAPVRHDPSPLPVGQRPRQQVHAVGSEHRAQADPRLERQLGSNNLWNSIASGSQDRRITQQARSLRSAGWDTFITFHKEPEREGTPADFRAAYDRIHRIFNNVGVRKATWIVTLTAATYNAGTAAQWLPSRYDLLGSMATAAAGCGADWKSFTKRSLRRVAFARARGQNLYMVEVGCTEGGSGRKAAGSTTLARRSSTGPRSSASPTTTSEPTATTTSTRRPPRSDAFRAHGSRFVLPEGPLRRLSHTGAAV